GDGAGDDDDVGILRVDARNRKVAAADATRWTRIGCDLLPILAAIIGAIDAEIRAEGSFVALAGDRGIEPRGLAGRNTDVDLNNPLRQAARERTPGPAAVGGLEESAAGAVVLIAVLPWSEAHLPKTRVYHIGIRRIDFHVGAADVFVLVERFLPGLPAVG